MNFDPETLGPSPGIAESWEVSEDKKTITFDLIEGAKWSDGEPITSEDVKWSLEVLGGNGLLFSVIHRKRQVDQDARRDDGRDRDEGARRPDGRRPLDLHPPRAHLGRGAAQGPDRLLSARRCRWSAAGPYIVTEFERSRITRMEREPGVARRRRPRSRRSSSSATAARTRPSARSTLGEVDFLPEVEPATFERLGSQEGIETVNAPTYSFSELAFNLCSEEDCPEAVFNPAIQDKTIRQATAYCDRPRAEQRDREPGDVVRRPRPAAVVLQGVLRGPGAGLPLRPGAGEPDPRRRGLGAERRRDPREGRRGRLVRPLRALGVARRHPAGEADRRADHRGRDRIQRPGGEHRQAHRAHDPQGRRQAGARVRLVHLGLGRGPLRPELPAEPDDDRRDRGVVGRLLLEPRVRPPVRGADHAVRHRRSARR